MKQALLLILILTGYSAICYAKDVDEARLAAESWLHSLDEAHYEETWRNAASIFKSKVTKQRWEEAASNVRDPLGALKSRELVGATETESVSGSPDGHYVVLRFRTSFEHKENAIETITPKLEDGVWRVSG